MGMTTMMTEMITVIVWAAGRSTDLEIKSWCFAVQKKTQPSQ
jgi:hypothetical protein